MPIFFFPLAALLVFEVMEDYTVLGIFQARILVWVAISSPVNLFNPGIKPRSPALQVDSLPAEPKGKPVLYIHELIS